MLGEQSLTDKLFWNCLSYLMNLKEKRAVTQIVSDLGIDNKFLNTLVSFLHSVQYFMEIREEDGIDVLVPAEKKPMINVEFNLLEWMQFQSYFPNICKIENFKVHGELHEKLSLLESKFKDHDLFSSISVLHRSHKGK